jgi:hypothetical protein
MEYTPENKELMENRIRFLHSKNTDYATKIKQNEKEIKRLQGVYDIKYADNPAYYYSDTGNPWAN